MGKQPMNSRYIPSNAFSGKIR